MNILAGKTILVVDDEKKIAHELQVTLEKSGFQVAVAYDGDEALEKVQEAKPDLVILDLLMPRVDGWTVLQEIRDGEITKDLPVVVLTVVSEPQSIVHGWRKGVDSYLCKPCDPVEMVALVNRMLKLRDEEQLADAAT